MTSLSFSQLKRRSVGQLIRQRVTCRVSSLDFINRTHSQAVLFNIYPSTPINYKINCSNVAGAEVKAGENNNKQTLFYGNDVVRLYCYSSTLFIRSKVMAAFKNALFISNWNILSLVARVFTPPARCRTLGIATAAADNWKQILCATDGTAIYHHSTRFSYLIDWAPVYILPNPTASIIINCYKA